MNPSFRGARVLVLESRRARELSSIVSSYGGVPVSAPSMREVPLESNTAAADAVRALIAGGFDIVILLTGVGARAWIDVADRVCQARDAFVDALTRVRVAVRGPKPLAVLRELHVPAWVTAPEPNTWRDLLAALDTAGADVLHATRVAVQEYGASNPELIAGLESRGALVTRVPVYQWSLPEDLEPLRDAIRRLVAGEIDVVLFTTGTQAVHLMQVAEAMQLAAAAREALRRIVVASIGPTTSEELVKQGIPPRLEPSHPKMGFLVREAAELVAGRAHERS
ncbi:MAG TPA: uroporphyrinogen-III synthase [Vicinamibacterales bacterium]|nr:uroporphyrinogen-III synthase [Vicinamibacterales bacterium]